MLEPKPGPCGRNSQGSLKAIYLWFLDLGVRPDVAPYLGRTGLHWAIPYGHLEVIRLLLERGADRPSADDEGPLHV
jgi:ankyrin repeat protein